MEGRAMRLIALILASVLFATPAARAEKRVALVIGNAAYKNAATLQNPRNDATDASEALKRLGFETIVGLDLDRDGMEEKQIAFARAVRDADVALVYYSGHAMQFGGSNYLMPVDAALRDQADLRRLTRVDDVVADLKQAKNLRVLVLDACRVNPLAEELSRSMELTRSPPVDRGLARIIAARGMIISYATQAGQTAADGQGRNSPYTMAFLKNIETSEEIGAIFRNITSDVYAATESKQLPELSLSLIGNFYLKGRPAQPGTDAAQAWAATQGATSQQVLEDFIKRYGDSFYGTLARARLEELKNAQASKTGQPHTTSSSGEQDSPGPISTMLGWLLGSSSTSPGPAAPENLPAQVAVVAPPVAPSPKNLSNDVAQRVVLFEEDPSHTESQYVGTAIWRTETVLRGPGQPPDVVIRANIEIPDRQMKVTWSLRHNTDKSLRASHTVDLMFTLPANFPHGEVANVPELMMKDAEQMRGVPLASQSVKVTTGYFLIGLSSVESDLRSNVQLLKDRTWFDIPIVYADGRRAILAVQKGPSGKSAFAEAFEKWSSDKVVVGLEHVKESNETPNTQVAVAVASPTAPGDMASLSPDEPDRLVRRGEDFLAKGDVSAARIVLGRAAEAHDARAALTLGSTYDPIVLRRMGVVGVVPDPEKAREWYQKAAEFGSAEASQRLTALGQLAR
jgi:uncharacterized caspase-like protein